MIKKIIYKSKFNEDERQKEIKRVSEISKQSGGTLPSIFMFIQININSKSKGNLRFKIDNLAGSFSSLPFSQKAYGFRDEVKIFELMERILMKQYLRLNRNGTKGREAKCILKSERG